MEHARQGRAGLTAAGDAIFLDEHCHASIYDATRLSTPLVFQLLRRTGIAVVEELPLLPPQEAVG